MHSWTNLFFPILLIFQFNSFEMTEFRVVDKLELAEQNVLNLQNEVEMMKKHLEKGKKFRRQYVDAVVESQRSDHQKLRERNKSTETRQFRFK